MKFFKELLEEVQEKICEGAQKTYDLYDDNRYEIADAVDNIKNGVEKTKEFIAEKTKESIRNLPETYEKTKDFAKEKLDQFNESYQKYNSLSDEELKRKSSFMASIVLNQRGYVNKNGKWIKKGISDIE